MVTYYEEKNIGKGIVVLLSGPILGLLYVVCLPFIAIAAIVTLIVKKIFGGVLSLARNLVSFGWRPSEAYLSGKKKNKKDNK
jgi:hypothetical protein